MELLICPRCSERTLEHFSTHLICYGCNLNSVESLHSWDWPHVPTEETHEENKEQENDFKDEEEKYL